jgi:Uma2 family endonuclease
MAEIFTSTAALAAFPDHTQLPESDGTFVKNFQEHPQSLILTDSLASVLQRLHPDGHYCIGQDSGIYWRETEPPERGAEAPDWFYVPGVPPKLDGQIRRSYVLWREYLSPLIVLEFASGDGSEERDRTPLARENGTIQKPGKFWVYERIMRIPYYGIYQVSTGELEMYTFLAAEYELMLPNERGHFVIPPLQVEIGVWQGSYQNQTMPWLRWWDLQGNLLPTGQELAQLERQEKEQALEEKEQALANLEQERQKRQQLAEKLRSLSPEQLITLGIEPEALA